MIVITGTSLQLQLLITAHTLDSLLISHCRLNLRLVSPTPSISLLSSWIHESTDFYNFHAARIQDTTSNSYLSSVVLLVVTGNLCLTTLAGNDSLAAICCNGIVICEPLLSNGCLALAPLSRLSAAMSQCVTKLKCCSFSLRLFQDISASFATCLWFRLLFGNFMPCVDKTNHLYMRSYCLEQFLSCDETSGEMNMIKTTCVKIVRAIRRSILYSYNLFPYILTVDRNSPFQGLVLIPPDVRNILTNIFLPRNKSVPTLKLLQLSPSRSVSPYLSSWAACGPKQNVSFYSPQTISVSTVRVD